MRAIKLPEPPIGSIGMPEIFEAGVYSVVRRAVVIGNGFSGAENQSIGLVRALGLADKQLLYVSFSRSSTPFLLGFWHRLGFRSVCVFSVSHIEWLL